MNNQSYNNNDYINLETAKAIRAALEKICYELAPQPLTEEITQKMSYQIFPALLSLKELKRLATIADKYDLSLVELANAYKKLREFYWENQLQKKHEESDDDYDFLKEIGIKW